MCQPSLTQPSLFGVAGLNVYSMLKHATLVLTVAAVERIEERLLTHMHSVDVEQQGKHKYTHTPRPFHNDPFMQQATHSVLQGEVWASQDPPGPR